MAHICGHESFLGSGISLTAKQDHRRVLVFYTPAQGHEHTASNLSIWHIMHEADIRKQAEEQVGGRDKIHSAEGCGGNNSATTTSWPIAGKAFSGDGSMVCPSVGYHLLVQPHKSTDFRAGTFQTEVS